MSEEQDWRLRVTLDCADGLDDLIERLRGREEVLGTKVGGALALGTVLSHDGQTLFAYASTRAGMDRARSAIESVLHATGRRADLRASRWDATLEEWCEADPSLADPAQQPDEAATIETQRHETRTLTCVVGRLERAWLQDYLVNHAQRHGLECAVTEERHLLSADLTFSISGPTSKLDAFTADAHRALNSLRWTGGAAGPPVGP